MNTMELLQKIFEVCIIPLLGVLTTYLVVFIRNKTDQLKKETDNELYQKYMEMLSETITNRVIATNQTYVEALKNKNRDRARFFMRQGKMYEEQIKSSDGQLQMIETQITQIENAQNQKDVFTVLKEGNAALKKLQEEVNVEKMQEIADDLDDLKDKNDELTQFFKDRGIQENEEELDDDLNKLIESVQKEDAKIDLPSANKENLEGNEEVSNKVQNKKKLVEA